MFYIPVLSPHCQQPIALKIDESLYTNNPVIVYLPIGGTSTTPPNLSLVSAVGITSFSNFTVIFLCEKKKKKKPRKHGRFLCIFFPKKVEDA